MSVEVHNHAGQQRATLVVLAKIEIADIKGKIRGDVLELPILFNLLLISFRSSLELVNVRRIQDRSRQTNGIADARVGVVNGNVDDIRRLLELCKFTFLE